MNPRRLFLLLCVLVLAGYGLSSWVDRPVSPSPQAMGAGFVSHPPFQGPPSDARQIRIHHANRANPLITLVRQSEKKWELKDPIVDPADPAAVSNLLAALFRDHVKKLPREWEGFAAEDLGLSPPMASVEVENKDGSVRLLHLGVRDLSGDAYAAQMDTELFRIEKGAAHAILRGTNTWRDPALFRGAGLIQNIQWTPAGGENPRKFVKRGGQWWQESPIEFPLSRTAQSCLIRMLRTRSYAIPQEVVTSYEKELVTQDPSSEHWVLRGPQGEVEMTRRGTLVLTSDRPFLLPIFIDDFRVSELDEDVWAARLLFQQIRASEIVSLMLVDGRGEHVWVKRTSGWTGPGCPAQGDVVSALVEDLLTLERGVGVQIPDRKPDGSFIASRSLTPLQKNGAALDWWVVSGSQILGVQRGSSTGYHLPTSFQRKFKDLVE